MSALPTGPELRRLVLLLVDGLPSDPALDPDAEGLRHIARLWGESRLATVGRVRYPKGKQKLVVTLMSLMGRETPRSKEPLLTECLVSQQHPALVHPRLAELLDGRGVSRLLEAQEAQPWSGIEAAQEILMRPATGFVLSWVPGSNILGDRETTETRRRWMWELDRRLPDLLLEMGPGDAVLVIGTPAPDRPEATVLAMGSGFRPKSFPTEPWQPRDIANTIGTWFRLNHPPQGRSFLANPLERSV